MMTALFLTFIVKLSQVQPDGVTASLCIEGRGTPTNRICQGGDYNGWPIVADPNPSGPSNFIEGKKL
jgi:hypothetical protein